MTYEEEDRPSGGDAPKRQRTLEERVRRIEQVLALVAQQIAIHKLAGDDVLDTLEGFAAEMS